MYKKSLFFIIYNIFFSFIYCGTKVFPTTDGRIVAVATTEVIGRTSEKTLYEKGLEDYDQHLSRRQSRGMAEEDLMLDYHHDDHKEVKKEEPKATSDDPWKSYYDFIINEGSFKFWAVFQLVTAVLLIYSAFAAVYYAKFNVITTDYDYYDDFYGRGRTNTDSQTNWSGLYSQTYQRIMDALSSKKYS